MKLFEKRPLSLILCVMLGAFSLFSHFSLTVKAIAISVSLILLLFFFIAKTKYITNLRFLSILVLSFIIAVFFSHLYFINFYPTEYYGEESYVVGVITDAEKYDGYCTKYKLDTVRINGSAEDYKLLIYVDNRTDYDFSVGNRIAFNGKIEELKSNADGFNSLSYYSARGISATVSSIKDLSLIDSRISQSINGYFKGLRIVFSNRLYEICDSDSASLLSALLLGEQSMLDASLKLNFQRTGITHILALSGMHLVVLATALSLLLKRVNKKIRIVTVILFTVLYMALVGFTPSVTRAGIMLIISSFLFLFSFSKDSITNLAISVFIIIAIEPYAIYDMSLWLSAFATLGIIIYSELSGKRKRAKNITLKILYYLADALLLSVFAITATLVFTLYNFSTFSLIAPIATLLFSFIITPYMYLGITVILLGAILPFFAEFTTHYTHFITHAADLFSDFKSIYVTYSLPFVKVLIITLSVAFFLFLVLEIKKKSIAVGFITALFMLLNLTAYVGTRRVISEDALYYNSVDNADCFLIKSEDEVALIIAGEPNISTTYDIVEYLTENNITYLDRIYMPVASEETIGSVRHLLSNVYTYELFIPCPLSERDFGIANNYAQLLSQMPTKLNFISKNDPQKIGEYYIYLLIGNISSGNGECAFIIDSEREVCTYLNSPVFLNGINTYGGILDVSDTVIVGGYEKTSYTKTVSYRLQTKKRILISANILFDNETIDYYENRGTITQTVESAVLYVE